MRPTVYIETSVISYLTARPSRDLIVAGHQQITVDWWDGIRPQVDCFVSPFVIDEASRGDEDAAQRRMAAIAGLTWNCRHLASARVRKTLAEINEAIGIRTPVICTPEELMEV